MEVDVKARLDELAQTSDGRAADIDRLDRDRVVHEPAVTSHPLMALLVELSRVVGDEHGGWVHWGATTQNITQTADVLLVRDAHRIVRRSELTHSRWART